VDEAQRRLICDAVTNKSKQQFSAILEAVQDSGGIAYSMDLARREADLAKQALARLPDSQFKSVMAELADFSISRLN
jgi:octaprenyl-diphosphate synthase